MKLNRFLMVVAFLGAMGTVALADTLPTDPVLLTSGCGKVGQPKCDAYLITSQNETINITLTLDTTVGDTFFGDATASFVNFSGGPLSAFTVNFTVPAGLSFQGCGATPPEGVTLFFTCTGGGSPDSPITGGGTAKFSLSGATVCSANFDDLTGGENGVTYTSDGDADDNCQPAFTLALQPVAGEILPPSISGTLMTAPEPSSSLLLLFGLTVGLMALKGFRQNIA